MRILIDADGCPVVDVTVRLARKHAVPCLILCDTSHVFKKDGAETLTVSKGADSVDFALVNLVQPQDIVVTQDYGLAAMCLARGARPIRQDGLLYTPDNIDGLLFARHTAKRIRAGGGRLKGSSRRTAMEDATFESALQALLSDQCRSQSRT